MSENPTEDVTENPTEDALNDPYLNAMIEEMMVAFEDQPSQESASQVCNLT